MRRREIRPALVVAALVLAGCSEAKNAAQPSDDVPPRAGASASVQAVAAERASVLEASGMAEPIAQATLSTRLMGTVTEVLVHEGDRVTRGQPLVRIDARDLAARSSQAGAGLADAEAAFGEAELQAERLRGLYADSAAPKAQLDAAEAGLARARAGVAAARGAAAELAAVRDYSVVRAPFAGVVVQRMVDPGSFAAPGAPLLVVQDPFRLRIAVTAAPVAARQVRRGETLAARIEGTQTTATVEGVVPAPGSGLYTINALVDNRAGRFLAGGSATLTIPQGVRSSVVIPASALVSQGDLTGVRVLDDGGQSLRWVRVGRVLGDSVEVLSGLRGGERLGVSAARKE